LRTRSWEKEGVTRYTTEVVGDNMTLLGSKPGGGGDRPTQQPYSQANDDMKGGDNSTDDLPF
jgi:single-strand DNA-binding protein